MRKTFWFAIGFFATIAFITAAMELSLASADVYPVAGIARILNNDAAGLNYGASVGPDEALDVNLEGKRKTYRVAITGLVNAASATDIVYINGSATKTVRITRIIVGGRATAAASADVRLIKRSATDTAGTCTASTIVPVLSTSAAATAVVSQCTANPTVGTAIGDVAVKQTFFGNLTTGQPGADADFTFGTGGGQPLTLVSAAETVGISLNAVTYSGGLIDVVIEFTEE